MNNLPDAKTLDKNDALAHLIDQFVIPKNTIYLDGNSLGALPKAAKKRAVEVVEQQWGQDLITSWNKHEWINLPLQIGEKIAPLIGAHEPGQVICCDSISVNLFKLLSACMSINGKSGRNVNRNSSEVSSERTSTRKRFKILSQRDNFPTDLYMVEGLQTLLGEHTVNNADIGASRTSCELVLCEEDEILDYIENNGHELIAVMLTHVNFRSGYIHNLPDITAKAHDAGALVIWDLAHSAGAVPVELDKHKVDFAVGCGYKYLNGGPGAPAFIYAAKRHLPHIEQPLSGWMGHARPFDFTPDYAPDTGIKKFLAGTPPIISMSVLDAALSVFNDVSIDELRAKSVALTTFFHQHVASVEALDSLVLISPQNANSRGSQLAYAHPQAYALCQALIAQGVVADFRAPNILRFGFSPSYLSFENLLRSIAILTEIMRDKSYEAPEFCKKNAVT
jgi:kynureninase